MNKINRMNSLWWLLATALVAAGLALLVFTEPLARITAWAVCAAAIVAYGILQAGNRSTRMEVGAVPPDPDRSNLPRREQRTDQELQDSFPASDAPSWTLGRDKRTRTRKNVGSPDRPGVEVRSLD